MYITKKADYAVRCILALAKAPGRIISAGEISQSMDIPKSFLAKILRCLSREGLVKSTQGVRGGFQLSKKPREINLLAVIEAVQGPSAMNQCAIDKRVCNRSGACAVHPIWVKLRMEIEARLKREDFETLAGKG
jgi:Rrf2 family protein